MSDGQTPEKPATFEDLPQWLQEMVMYALLCGQRLQDAMRSEDIERSLDAADDGERATEALQDAILDASRRGETLPRGFTPADAAKMLLIMRERDRLLLPVYIEFCLKHAFAESDDPQTRELRERTRATLVRHWVTEYELETFPPASVIAIVWDRYRAWDEAN
jgi:hypothetical protein